MTEPNKSPSQEERFILSLQKLTDDKNGKKPDRAALAALRRGLGKTPGEASEMHRYVVPFTSKLTDQVIDNYYLVASLFALHQISWTKIEQRYSNLGASFFELKDSSDSIEKRFVALLNCRQEDLSDHLRHAVSLLKSKEIGIDWLQLLKDLDHWNSDKRFVQRNWASAFWSNTSNESSDSSTTEHQPENQSQN